MPHGLAAAQPPGIGQPTSSPLTEESSFMPSAPMKEIRDAIVRLPLAAVLGTALALRPRKRGQGRRSVLVVQTQIMLAVVGAVIMLVVGNSLSRAFGIVGAAGLVRYRSTIDDPKEAVVMLCALGAGLAAGVGLYILAPFATFFMAAVLWAVEYFEPPARKYFELTVTTGRAAEFRPKVEGVLHGLGLEYRTADRIRRRNQLQRVGAVGRADARRFRHDASARGRRRDGDRVGREEAEEVTGRSRIETRDTTRTTVTPQRQET
ncbi:MAG: hypothetical protein QM736_01890 [Vicinamibacterales bacterium]